MDMSEAATAARTKPADEPPKEAAARGLPLCSFCTGRQELSKGSREG